MVLGLIGESFLAGVIEVLVHRIASPEVRDYFRTRKLDDGMLKRLKATMRSVGKLLNDAETKQITDSAVRDWLDDLRDAVYEADDFLDEIAYQALQSKLEAEPQSKTCMGQVRSFLPSLVPCSRKGMGEMQPQLEKILHNLQSMLEEKDVLGLVEHIGEKPCLQKLPTTSLVDESGVYGRDADKEAITKLLLAEGANARRLDVISIVGMGGIGKTTLAQRVYNDRIVSESFDLKSWVYVSEELDVLKVTKDILKSVCSMNCDNMTEDQLHCELEKKLTGNKVLLVLDDVWSDNQDQWDFLRRPFKSVRHGSKIIVTTRKENVALVCSTVPSTHHLRELTEVDCWLVLSKHAFDDGNWKAHPELEVIGRKIARKCKGLPLAAKTLGGLLHSKRNVSGWKAEWEKILKSNLWDLQNDNILPALRLSYHDLPSYLKQCFAYCSIFPKGYIFEKEELILLWMAEGFLVQPEGNSEMEEMGSEYFHDLLLRSFFQQSNLNPPSYIMHDLINDLAKSVAREFCFQLDDGDSNKATKRTRHLSLILNTNIIGESFRTFKAICDLQLLHTFMPAEKGHMQANHSHTSILGSEAIHDLLVALKRIRVLSIGFIGKISVLPASINNLKHLRYLDLSDTNISRLPESICSLYNLQTLILSGCSSLVQLPAETRRLINLRHLHIKGTNLQEMPPEMGKLTKLRELTDFFVGKHFGSNIKELGELHHLRGEIFIRNLQNITDARDVLEARLKDKEHLESLGLIWDGASCDSLVHERTLEQLQPHANLKGLYISGYGGTSFLDWIGDCSLPLLKKLRISGCPNLKKALSTCFPALNELEIWDCEQLEIECFPFELFPELECLTIYGCPNLVSFSEGESAATNLRKLELGYCTNLKSLPKHVHSLERLEIINCPEVESFPEEGLPSKLQSLDIKRCNKLIANRTQWNLQSLPSLSRFSFGHYQGLESFPEERLLPPTLASLEIRSLFNLKWLDYKGLQHLTSLTKIVIVNCSELQSMPEQGLPSSLLSLHISDCPLLKKRCEKEKGEDWPKISHIASISIH